MAVVEFKEHKIIGYTAVETIPTVTFIRKSVAKVGLWIKMLKFCLHCSVVVRSEIAVVLQELYTLILHRKKGKMVLASRNEIHFSLWCF